MEILEDEHGRAVLGERLEEAASGGERLLAGRRRLVDRETDERAQVALDPGGLASVGQERGDRPRQLRRGLAAVVGFEDAGLRLDDLAERPVAMPSP